MAGTRILVEQPVYEDVVAALSAAAGAIPVGDPFAEGTIIGPMTGAKQLARVTGFVDRARANGSLRVAGGDVPSPDLGGGYYQRPVVVADVTQDSELVQQEIFGPVVTVQPFDDEDHAIRLANSTSFGLAGGLQTSDMKRAHRVAAALKAGTVWVNQWGLLDVQMPIGGYKQSGYGRENGPEGLAEYLQAKSVLIASV
jgi:acyl-CoA reductase-like NAD-dependent aldehyde dehydrogenase